MLISSAGRRITRKRVIESQRRYERACKRIADANGTFCERGGMTEQMTFFAKAKIGMERKSIPT